MYIQCVLCIELWTVVLTCPLLLTTPRALAAAEAVICLCLTVWCCGWGCAPSTLTVPPQKAGASPNGGRAV